ncbi:MAG: hypothetical protein IJG09_07920 [Methanobrevibacter sp.]|nr:hypothetical protein [Methanobrevibacter sp.]
MEYNECDVPEILENVRKNPYGIKDTYHLIIRSGDRFVNLDLIYRKINSEKPVLIQKTVNASNKFLLTYNYTKLKDLAIAIFILDEDEIMILTVIDKFKERRV